MECKQGRWIYLSKHQAGEVFLVQNTTSIWQLPFQDIQLIIIYIYYVTLNLFSYIYIITLQMPCSKPNLTRQNATSSIDSRFRLSFCYILDKIQFSIHKTDTSMVILTTHNFHSFSLIYYYAYATLFYYKKNLMNLLVLTIYVNFQLRPYINFCSSVYVFLFYL